MGHVGGRKYLCFQRQVKPPCPGAHQAAPIRNAPAPRTRMFQLAAVILLTGSLRFSHGFQVAYMSGHQNETRDDPTFQVHVIMPFLMVIRPFLVGFLATSATAFVSSPLVVVSNLRQAHCDQSGNPDSGAPPQAAICAAANPEAQDTKNDRQHGNIHRLVTEKIQTDCRNQPTTKRILRSESPYWQMRQSIDRLRRFASFLVIHVALRFSSIESRPDPNKLIRKLNDI